MKIETVNINAEQSRALLDGHSLEEVFEREDIQIIREATHADSSDILVIRGIPSTNISKTPDTLWRDFQDNPQDISEAIAAQILNLAHLDIQGKVKDITWKYLTEKNPEIDEVTVKPQGWHMDFPPESKMALLAKRGHKDAQTGFFDSTRLDELLSEETKKLLNDRVYHLPNGKNISMLQLEYGENGTFSTLNIEAQNYLFSDIMTAKPEHQEALNQLNEIIKKNSLYINLNQGDMVIWDNSPEKGILHCLATSFVEKVPMDHSRWVVRISTTPNDTQQYQRF